MKRLILSILKFVLIASLILMVLFFVIVKFSISETIYLSCKGKFDQNQHIEKPVYLKIEKLRLWVKLWSEDEAMVTIEYPEIGIFPNYYIRTSILDKVILYRYDRNIGSLSTLSGNISIKTNFDDSFTGKCKTIQKTIPY
jgi:hypothetical protein